MSTHHGKFHLPVIKSETNMVAWVTPCFDNVSNECVEVALNTGVAEEYNAVIDGRMRVAVAKAAPYLPTSNDKSKC